LPRIVTLQSGPAQNHDCPPELQLQEEGLYYDNPELFFSESENEEHMEDEFHFHEDGVRQSNSIDPNSIKYLYREETWS
jgi:hypothetical protein